MRISDFVIQRKKTVIVIWILVFLALSPLLLNYGQFISYSVIPKSLTDSESEKAQAILSSELSLSNSTLIVEFQPGGVLTADQIVNETLAFQRTLNSSSIPFYSGSISAPTAYQKFLEEVLTPSVVNGILETYYNFTQLATEVYSFPSSFLGNWSQYDYSQLSISLAAARAYYNGSSYEASFLKDLNQTYSLDSLTPMERVQNATGMAAISSFFDSNPFLIFAVVDSVGYNVSNYLTDTITPISSYLTAYSGFQISNELVESSLVAGNNASNFYVSKYGLLDVPSFIRQDYISGDNSTYVINVSFNVSESYRGSNDFYPAQNATSKIENLAKEYFGNSVRVTGMGAVSADIAHASASGSFAFIIIFVALAIAVGVLFVSILPSILVLIFVSLATALGNIAIYITGMILGYVDYEVTYTLTAVILGVSTDYFVFILSRYREELREGRSNAEALSIGTKRAGFVVLVSGVTIALSLGAISLISGLESWGPVLLIAIVLAVGLETTIVPALMSWLGPRIFVNSWIKFGRKRSNRSSRSSSSYRAAQFSQRHKFLVCGFIVLFAVPSAYFWFTVPTTYNINEGLPQSAMSVQALNTISHEFGSNIIYPTFVVVNFTQKATEGDGSLTPSATVSLEADATALLGSAGIKEVIGPTVNGTKIEPSQLDSRFVFNNGLNAYFIVFTKYDPYSNNAISIINQLRQSKQFTVGGLTSSVIDSQHYYSAAFKEVELIILVVIASILALAFRSAKYPLISLSGVFISITWATAILYLITRFVLRQQLVFLIPVILYVILMAVGNDFSVFILSRVKEEVKNFGFGEGLARAMSGSGATVISLGLVLAVSLGSLGLVPFGFLEQLGIAFVISLIVDTFVIRTFYFPSMLAILEKKRYDNSGAL